MLSKVQNMNHQARFDSLVPNSTVKTQQQFEALESREKEAYLKLIIAGVKPEHSFNLVYLALLLSDQLNFEERIDGYAAEFERYRIIVLA
ncbi:MAG: hypothetical protein ACO1OF_16525 [Adhaeribacter sp.]